MESHISLGGTIREKKYRSRFYTPVYKKGITYFRNRTMETTLENTQKQSKT